MVAVVDPERLPPDPDFESARGPAVAAERLAIGALRARFAQLGAPDAARLVEQPGDGALVAGRVLRAAAVLIGLIDRPEGAQVLFTVRSGHLNDHAGQISFPGGRVDPDDAGPVEAALREAHEEVGVDRRRVQVLGTLPAYLTISGYRVTPVVGWIDPAVVLQADPLEVEEFFEVPLAFLMDSANHQRLLVVQGDQRRTVYAISYVGGGRRYLIWGATAAMLRNFYRFVAADLPAAAGPGGGSEALGAAPAGAMPNPLQSAP